MTRGTSFRRAPGSIKRRFDGMMGATHYAAMLLPARALGDRALWPELKALLLQWVDSGGSARRSPT